jgi:hypothetical protein
MKIFAKIYAVVMLVLFHFPLLLITGGLMVQKFILKCYAGVLRGSLYLLSGSLYLLSGGRR